MVFVNKVVPELTDTGYDLIAYLGNAPDFVNRSSLFNDFCEYVDCISIRLLLDALLDDFFRQKPLRLRTTLRLPKVARSFNLSRRYNLIFQQLNQLARLIEGEKRVDAQLLWLYAPKII